MKPTEVLYQVRLGPSAEPDTTQCMDQLVAAVVGGLPLQTLHTTAAMAVADLMFLKEDLAHLVLLARQVMADKMVLQAHLALTAVSVQVLATAAVVVEQVQQEPAEMVPTAHSLAAAAEVEEPHAMATIQGRAAMAPMVLFGFGAGDNDLRSA
jgi:hypothetical protein